MKTQLNTTIMALLLATISTAVTATDPTVTVTVPKTEAIVAVPTDTDSKTKDTVTVPTVTASKTPKALKVPTITVATNPIETITVTKDDLDAIIKDAVAIALKDASKKETTPEEDTSTPEETTLTETTSTKATDPKVETIVTVPTEATAAKKLATGYVGVSVGVSNLDMGIADLMNGASFDENNQGVKIFVGFDIDDKFSIEGHFANLGGGTISGKHNDSFTLNGKTYTFDIKKADGITSSTATASIDATTINYGVSSVYNFTNIYDFINPTNVNKITPFVKLGLHRWETKFDSGAINVDVDKLTTESGIDAFYGLGVSAEITDGISAKLEFERFGMNKDTDYVSLVIVSDY
jgi:hypothetical protein